MACRSAGSTLASSPCRPGGSSSSCCRRGGSTTSSIDGLGDDEMAATARREAVEMAAAERAVTPGAGPAQPASAGSLAVLRVLGYLRPYRWRCLLILLAILVELSFNTLFALSFKVIIDGALSPRDGRLL